MTARIINIHSQLSHWMRLAQSYVEVLFVRSGIFVPIRAQRVCVRDQADRLWFTQTSDVSRAWTSSCTARGQPYPAGGSRVSAKPHSVIIVQVYAPIFTHENNEVEEFYQQLDKDAKAVPKKDILVLLGGWIAKVGPDAYRQCARMVGKFGLRKTKEFSQSQRITLANSLHLTTNHGRLRDTHQTDWSITKSTTSCCRCALNPVSRTRRGKATAGGKFAALNLVDCGNIRGAPVNSPGSSWATKE